jgi:hypothetical protein
LISQSLNRRLQAVQPPALTYTDWETMKKYLHAALLATTLATALSAPAYAQSKFIVSSPEDPLHRRTVVICAVLLVALHAYTRRGRLPGKR